MKALIVLFLLIWAIILYLFYLNRAADKVFETMAVVTLAMISSLFFVMRSEKIEKDIFPVYFYNVRLNDLIPVEGVNDYMYERMLIRYYKEENKEPLEIDKILPNLLEKSIIDWFSLKATWPRLLLSANVGGIASQITPLTGKNMETKIKTSRITQAEIEKLMEGNFFSHYFYHPAPLTLPVNMKLHIERNKSASKIILKDKYCKITLDLQTPLSGAGYSVQEHMSVSKFLNIPEEELDGTYVVSSHINFKVTFSRLFAGNPEMNVYKKWIKDIIDHLESDYSWNKKRQSLLDNILVDIKNKSENTIEE